VIRFNGLSFYIDLNAEMRSERTQSEIQLALILDGRSGSEIETTTYEMTFVGRSIVLLQSDWSTSPDGR